MQILGPKTRHKETKHVPEDFSTQKSNSECDSKSQLKLTLKGSKPRHEDLISEKLRYTKAKQSLEASS